MSINTNNWEKMTIEDKILFIQESVCYLLALGTLAAIIYAINLHLVGGSLILLIGVASFIACSINARSSQDLHIIEYKVKNKLIKNIRFSTKKA